MGTRVLVQCRSQDMPGEPAERLTQLANKLCQHQWQRPFDNSQDRLQSTGQYLYDGNRIHVLLDNGPLDSAEPSLSVYRWDGQDL